MANKKITDLPLRSAAGDDCNFPVDDGTQTWRITLAQVREFLRPMPVGGLIPFAGSVEPDGFLFCYGQEVNRLTYAALFTAIGTTYGAGDGTTTFNLPDLRGRTVIGRDDMGGVAAARVTNAVAGINANNLGAAGGVQSVTLTALQSGVRAHSHGITDPGHSHGISGTIGRYDNYNAYATLANWNGGAHANTQPVGTGISVNNATAQAAQDAHTNVQPSFVLNYLIKAS